MTYFELNIKEFGPFISKSIKKIGKKNYLRYKGLCRFLYKFPNTI